MTSTKRTFPSIVVVVAVVATTAVLCAQLGCSLRSLDYLKNGTRPDSGLAEAPQGQPWPPDLDADLPDVAATEDETGSEIDGGRAIDLAAGGAGGGIDSGAGGAGGALDGAADATKTGSGGRAGTGGGTGSGGSSSAGGRPGTGGRLGTGGQGTGGSGTAGSGGSSAPPGKSVLFVVGSVSLGRGDSAVKSRLANSGFSVTVVADSGLGNNPKVSQDLVLVSRTITSTNVGTKFRALAKPVMVWEPSLYDDMGMVPETSGSFGSTTSNSTSLVVNAAAGALAAGLSGTVVAFSSAQELNYGVPNAQAITVASVPGHAEQWAAFAYDVGAQMPGLAAPARRMAFFFSDASAANLNNDGWRLFDAAVTWLCP
jgi:hypothetical protein